MIALPSMPNEVTAPKESSAARPTELANEGSFSYANWHSSFSYGSDLSVLKRANSFLEALELGRSSWNRSLPFSKLDGFRNSSYQSALSTNTECRIERRYFTPEIGNKSSSWNIFKMIVLLYWIYKCDSNTEYLKLETINVKYW